MIGVFKQKNSINALVLFVYALVLKFPMFLHPVVPVLHKEDNYFYRFILNALDALFHYIPVFFSLITFLLLFMQATLLNTICNYHRILPKPNYLPGMAYILVTSLLQDWNHFSAPLLVNSIMIWSWYKMIGLYGSKTPIGAIFNIGLFIGISSLLYMPAIAFLILLFFALLVMRSVRLNEWLICLLGVTTPYYFYAAYLFFSNKWSWLHLFQPINVALPSPGQSLWLAIGGILLIIPFLIGGYFVQENLRKMLIQVRKNWSLMLIYLLFALFIPFLNNTAEGFENWILIIVPFAAFHACTYLYPPQRWIPVVIFWLSILFILVYQYGGPGWH